MSYERAMRTCRVCGKSCYGSRCRECFLKKHRGQISRWKSRKIGE